MSFAMLLLEKIDSVIAADHYIDVIFFIYTK